MYKLYPIVMNAERNADRIRNLDLYTVPFLDLAVGYIYKPDSDAWNSTIINVTNQMVKEPGIKPLDIYTEAMNNLAVDMVFKPLDEVIKECGGDVEDNVEDSCAPPFMVLTTEDHLYGAATILDRGFLNGLSVFQRWKDILILPSSVHEIIITPYMESVIDLDVIETTIREVNADMVEDGDILADHPYFFSWKEQKVKMIL